MEYIEIKKIVVDPNNPRKDFDASKMASLRKSIDKHGVKNPVTVTDNGDGTFMLLDGERRFRTAVDLGLKKVPAVIDQVKDETERLIVQFNIQEQHAAWSPLEKAVALTKLADRLDGTVKEVCDMLGMTLTEQRIYAAFAGLADKENYVRHEVPLTFAPVFKSMSNEVRRLKTERLGEAFIKSDEKDLERALVRSIKDGSINDKKHVTRLKDAFVKNPKLIDKYLTDKHSTPDALFIEAKAMSSYYLRNLTIQSNQIANLGRRFLENNTEKIDVNDEQVRRMRSAYEVMGKVLKALS